MNYLKHNAAYLAVSLAVAVPTLAQIRHSPKPEMQLEERITAPVVEEPQINYFNHRTASASEIYVPPFFDDFTNDSDEILLARLLFGEARGASIEVKYAIANVVLNRAEHPCGWGRNIREVILAPRQFSCFNSNDVNRRKLADPLRYERAEIWQECYNTAHEVLSAERRDTTHGATHYFDSSVTTPRWARNLQPVLTLPAGDGRSVRFYNTVL